MRSQMIIHNRRKSRKKILQNNCKTNKMLRMNKSRRKRKKRKRRKSLKINNCKWP